eukprot:CAMPEP_0113553618 /NCGR_PEP_ID=MMETSP0015_2-20120614/15711_1 /TAXON_ID=2838 /ORGANISM="Odontella" /LENGTH=275 /DNA_ID=CAMNT_0000454703 /DNA_START=116 /DNA_END=943 /DNA_ORIENTATION=- /assembly_acc=CAM_ASM_000160
MKLYSHVERIENELRHRGLGVSSKTLDPEVLSEIDSMHYEGDEGMKAAIAALKLNKDSAVLDVGSGFGGPARILASRTGCSVTALELQRDIHDKAEELTRRCKLDSLAKHMQGNILECDLNMLGNGPGTYDAIVSWLVYLHIADKAALLRKCAEMLKEGGVFFTDDYYMREKFTDAEEKSLKDDVYASNLPTKEQYVKSIEMSGFVGVTFEDKTDEWKQFVNDRLQAFVQRREKFEEVHGTPTYEQLLFFYTAVVNLFNGGHLGGARISAKKTTQ